MNIGRLLYEIWQKEPSWFLEFSEMKPCMYSDYFGVAVRDDSIERAIIRVWLHYYGDSQYRIEGVM